MHFLKAAFQSNIYRICPASADVMFHALNPKKKNMYKTDCFATQKSQRSALAAVVPSVPSVASTPA